MGILGQPKTLADKIKGITTIKNTYINSIEGNAMIDDKLVTEGQRYDVVQCYSPSLYRNMQIR